MDNGGAPSASHPGGPATETKPKRKYLRRKAKESVKLSAESEAALREPITRQEACDALLAVSSLFFRSGLTNQAAEVLCKRFGITLPELRDDGTDDAADAAGRKSKRPKKEISAAASNRGKSAYSLFVSYVSRLKLLERRDLPFIKKYVVEQGADLNPNANAMTLASHLWAAIPAADKKRLIKNLKPFLDVYKEAAGKTPKAAKGDAKEGFLSAFLKWEKEHPEQKLERLLRLDGNKDDLDGAGAAAGAAAPMEQDDDSDDDDDVRSSSDDDESDSSLSSSKEEEDREVAGGSDSSSSSEGGSMSSSSEDDEEELGMAAAAARGSGQGKKGSDDDESSGVSSSSSEEEEEEADKTSAASSSSSSGTSSGSESESESGGKAASSSSDMDDDDDDDDSDDDE